MSAQSSYRKPSVNWGRASPECGPFIRTDGAHAGSAMGVDIVRLPLGADNDDATVRLAVERTFYDGVGDHAGIDKTTAGASLDRSTVQIGAGPDQADLVRYDIVDPDLAFVGPIGHARDEADQTHVPSPPLRGHLGPTSTSAR